MEEEKLQRQRTIEEIKHRLDHLQGELSDEERNNYAKDPRKGVQKALKAYDQKIAQAYKILNFVNEKRELEKSLRAQNYHFIAGIDEVGRGPLAGPVVAAAVILPEDFPCLPLDDSKSLSVKKREAFAEVIQEKAIAYAYGSASVSEIDSLNILNASRLAMKRAVQALSVQADYLLIDAIELDLPIKQKSMIKGDATVYVIAAASIIAKVYRDSLMKEYASIYPAYDFASNMGYGTKKHMQALRQYGPCPLHRKTFKPVQKYC